MAVTPGVAAAVAKGAETVVATVTAAGAVNFKGIVCSGTCLGAIYRVYISGVRQYTRRTPVNDPDAYLLVPDHPVTTGVVIEVKVIHYETKAQDFEGTIITS